MCNRNSPSMGKENCYMCFKYETHYINVFSYFIQLNVYYACTGRVVNKSAWSVNGDFSRGLREC